MIARKTRDRSNEPHPFGWIESTEVRVNGRVLTPGTEVKLIDRSDPKRNRRGRFRFVKHVVTPDGKEWLDFIGGKAGHEAWTSAYASEVRTVHRIARTRQSEKRAA
jgi:hypothetical protein